MYCTRHRQVEELGEELELGVDRELGRCPAAACAAPELELLDHIMELRKELGRVVLVLGCGEDDARLRRGRRRHPGFGRRH